MRPPREGFLLPFSLSHHCPFRVVSVDVNVKAINQKLKAKKKQCHLSAPILGINGLPTKKKKKSRR